MISDIPVCSKNKVIDNMLIFGAASIFSSASFINHYFQR